MGKRILILVLGIIGVLAVVAVVMVVLAKPAGDCPPCLRDQPRPLVIAHQGGEGLWPSNTMYAFERAVAMGVDMLEMDLHVTSDGGLVLMHDETVDRTTDGSGRLEEMTLAEVKALDAGYRWTPDDGQTFPYRGQGITVATVEELFQTFPDMPMNIEIKLVESQPVAGPFCQLIRKYNMQDKVLVASFHQDAMDEFRATCPEVSTSIAKTKSSTSLCDRSWAWPAATAPRVKRSRYRNIDRVSTSSPTALSRISRSAAWTCTPGPSMRSKTCSA